MCYLPWSTFSWSGTIIPGQGWTWGVGNWRGSQWECWGQHRRGRMGWSDSWRHWRLRIRCLKVVFVLFILEPWLGPELGPSWPPLRALAQPDDSESWSQGKPGQSHGFQAKPGWNITIPGLWICRLIRLCIHRPSRPHFFRPSSYMFIGQASYMFPGRAGYVLVI